MPTPFFPFSLLTEEEDFSSHDELHADRCSPLLTPGDALQEHVAHLIWVGEQEDEQKQETMPC